MHVILALVATVLRVTYEVLQLYIYVIVAGVILSWLVIFNVVNPHSRFVRMIGDFLFQITEPVLRPIRRILPPLGGMDLSPLALMFLIWGTQYFIGLLLQMFLRGIFL